MRTTAIELGVGVERPEVPVVQGGVRVLLRLDDPDEEVGELDDPVHLEPVRGLDGVEVGQIEKDESAQARLVDPVAPSDLEPVEQRVRTVPPDWPPAPRGRRPATADRCELGPAQGVEEQRLARAGRAGERHHGRLDPEPEPRSRLLGHAPRVLDLLRLEPAVRDADGLCERGQAPVEIERSRGASDGVDRAVEARDRLRLGRLVLEQLRRSDRPRPAEARRPAP